MVAFRGSILGVGTDIAGSIRIPALCCGVYGFKPTIDRIPFGGQVSGAKEGLPGLKPAAGPLGHSIDDLELFMSTVLNAEPWRYDAGAVAVPWQKIDSPRSEPLTIGILPEDPCYPLHPPVRRALDTAIKALTRQGHRIVRLSIDPMQSVSYANRLAFQYFIFGPYEDHTATSGEPPVLSVANKASPMFTGSFPVENDLDPFEKIHQLQLVRKRLADSWRKTWTQNGLDVILAPGSQSTAVPHDTYGWPPYTLVWNVLDVRFCFFFFVPRLSLADAVVPGLYHPVRTCF